jgi:plastocyanin
MVFQFTDKINLRSTNNKPDSAAQSISIKVFAFTPKELTINKGDTVTWTNEDAVKLSVS